MASDKKLFSIISIMFLLFFSSFWVLQNLDLCALWQDEAETACVSRTIEKYGIPKGFDGLNHFSQQEGREYGANYEWKLHPWFQFYWAAGSFALFGESTWSARFPFALLGICSILLSFFLAKRIWKDDKTAWFLALAFLMNIFFILMVRQARYYAPVMFFSLYSLWGLLDILDKKRIGYLHFILGTLLLFQSQYLFCINFWIASLVYSFIFYRDRFKHIALSVLLAAAPSIPFLIWILDTPYGETLKSIKDQQNFLHGIQLFGYNFFHYIVQPQWLLLALGIIIFKKNFKKLTDFDLKKEHISLFFLLLIVGNIVSLSLTVPEYYVRYLCAVLPFGLLLMAGIAHHAAKINTFIPWGLLAITVLFMGDVANYTEELKEKKFLGPIDGFVNFLLVKAGKDAKVAISYGDLPLKFYTENKIYGGLAGDLPENLDSVDVFIIRANPIHDMDFKVREKMLQYLDKNKNAFQAMSPKIEDSPFQNREVPNEHYYKTQPLKNSIVVHARIR